MSHLAMSININKDLVDFSSPNLHGPSHLNYLTYIQQRDSSITLAIATKKGIPSQMSSGHRVGAITKKELRKDYG